MSWTAQKINNLFNPHRTLWLGALGLKITREGQFFGDTGREGGMRKVGEGCWKGGRWEDAGGRKGGEREEGGRSKGAGREEGGRMQEGGKEERGREAGVRVLAGRKVGGCRREEGRREGGGRQEGGLRSE